MSLRRSHRLAMMDMPPISAVSTLARAVSLSPPVGSRRTTAATTGNDLYATTGKQSGFTPVTPSPKKPSRKRKTPASPLPETSSESSPVWTRRVLAAINPTQPYLDLDVPPDELRPSATLTTGQSFVWKAVVDDEDESAFSSPSTKTSAWGSHNATEWVGILRINSELSAVVAIRETPNTTLYRPLASSTGKPNDRDWKTILKDYFQLNHSLQNLYQQWSEADPRLATIAKCIPGVRILDQDPWECLVSFICSSNNNIPRITKMVNAIRREYGQPLLRADQDHCPETLYSFPGVNELVQKATDQDLREKCGLGYRSKYILETLQLLQERGGESYLQELRQISDPLVAQTKLCEFCGVGRKVADCVALFSLRQVDAIPVDVHVWNIARRDYDPDQELAKIKSLTPTTYKQVGDVFRKRFPSKAGWAHSLLFVAELPSFRPVLPAHLVQEMDDFAKEEKMRKQEVKETKKKRTSDQETTD